ncbi:hypothetical protein [Streptomyces doebereineriae]|uniref:Uncharacterized protein n=1 Tax=Streptomyces doebereineriae TaxID=3075528 RepID=A0ABU2VMP8_9ACTN|nr:hypothetical protein [Streptomyces sp. DSM 41640]MDT0486132.1 hypothetical protein [Streptomyces sp. DSM 41640]
MRKKRRTLSLLSLTTVLLAAVLPVVLLRGQLFGTDDSSQLAAVLTYIGVLVSASVALIGYGVNLQTEQRLWTEQEEQQRQLRLEAAMRAGQLVSPGDSGPAHPAALASGLLALTRLDHGDLAVVLLVDLWSGDQNSTQAECVGGEERWPKVSHETAILVIDAALRSKSGNAQLVAAELLCRNAERLDACQSLHWPSAVDGCWDPMFSPRTKLLIVEALIRMTLAGHAEEGALRSVAVRLYGIWYGDHSKEVRGCIGKFIGKIIGRLQDFGLKQFVHGPKMVTIADLKKAATSAAENPDDYLAKLSNDLGNALGEWAASCHEQPPHPGSLATAAILPQ